MTVLEETANTPAAWSSRADRGEPWQAAGWSRTGQSERFRKVAAALDVRAGESLLDYGCGTGAFSELLDDHVDYVGYDWAEGMIRRARRDHPNRRFQIYEPRGSFDLVVAVGPFNLPDRWSKERTWQTLRALWDRTGRALAVSLYAGHDDRCLIYTQAECEAFAFSETYYARVEYWRPNDILLLLEKGRP